MDKSCHSSIGSTTTNSSSSSGTDQYLRHLNKISHKISKPVSRPTFDHPHRNLPQPPPPPPPPLQQQHQPPVYNIKKSDFRDVVQKLTGSPAHERFSTPPPIQPSKPPSSRLQRIRPPPLAQLSNRPPFLLNNAAPTVNPSVNTSATAGDNHKWVSSLSPLPPFPSVHAAAESPISAYMRYFQNTPQPLPLAFPPQNFLTSPTSTSMAQNPFLFTSSPLPLGCFPSPRLSYPPLSPSLLFSPSTDRQFGFQRFPVSPRMPVPSPRWKDLVNGGYYVTIPSSSLLCPSIDECINEIL